MKNGTLNGVKERPVTAAPQGGDTRLETAPPAEVMWRALMEDSGVDVAVLDRRGTVRAVSIGAGLWPLPEGAASVGQPITAYFPPEIAQERSAILAQVFDSMKPLAVETSWRGVPACSVLRPFFSSTGEPLVLLTCRPVALELREGRPVLAPTDVPKIKAQKNDEGPLSKLTPREREVLALIAQGHTTAQIAKILYRSAKTIEAHRMSLGLKLRARNRVDLARFAMQAGLQNMQVPRGGPDGPEPVEQPASNGAPLNGQAGA